MVDTLSQRSKMRHFRHSNLVRSRFFATANCATAEGTARRVAQYGWQWPLMLSLPGSFFLKQLLSLFLHLSFINSGGEPLTIGRIGFGSPHFAAPFRREEALRSALLSGCNLVELDEPVARDDPRINEQV